MAMRLSLPAAYRQQPTTMPRLAESTLTNKLVEAITPINNKWVSIGKWRYGHGAFPFTESSGGFVPAYSAYGSGASWAGVANTVCRRESAPPVLGIAPGDVLDEFSVLCLCMPRVISTAFSTIFSYGNSGSVWPAIFLRQGSAGSTCGMVFQDTSSTDITEATSTEWANNKLALVIFTRSFARNSMVGYINSREFVSETVAARGSATFDRTGIGGLVRTESVATGCQFPFNGTVFLVATWMRALEMSEVFSLSANPWQIFDYPSRPIFTDQAAAADFMVRQGLNISQAVNRASTY